MANNILKYRRIDVAELEKRRHEWNAPVLWPLALMALVVIPAVVSVSYRRRERRRALN